MTNKKRIKANVRNANDSKIGLRRQVSYEIIVCPEKSLGVGLIAPNAMTDDLATIWLVGNKRLQGELSNVIKAHEENSFIDSGLRKKERRKDRQVEHWKEGWVE